MKNYIVTYSKEVRRLFVVQADDIDEAKRIVEDDSDDDAGLLDEWVHQANIEGAREMTKDDVESYQIDV